MACSRPSAEAEIAHVLVRVVQVTDECRDDRRADRFQDQRELVPLFFG